MTTAEILICDDEPVLREMVRDFLTGRGFSVTETGNAAELLHALIDTRPDLVILDINMPGEDGLSALRKLRVDSNVPVIMLTAGRRDRQGGGPGNGRRRLHW